MFPVDSIKVKTDICGFFYSSVAYSELPMYSIDSNAGFLVLTRRGIFWYW